VACGAARCRGAARIYEARTSTIRSHGGHRALNRALIRTNASCRVGSAHRRRDRDVADGRAGATRLASRVSRRVRSSRRAGRSIKTCRVRRWSSCRSKIEVAVTESESEQKANWRWPTSSQERQPGRFDRGQRGVRSVVEVRADRGFEARAGINGFRGRAATRARAILDALSSAGAAPGAAPQASQVKYDAAKDEYNQTRVPSDWEPSHDARSNCPPPLCYSARLCRHARALVRHCFARRRPPRHSRTRCCQARRSSRRCTPGDHRSFPSRGLSRRGRRSTSNR